MYGLLDCFNRGGRNLCNDFFFYLSARTDNLVNWNFCWCVLCNARTKSQVMAVITALMKRPENNAQLTLTCWKFNWTFKVKRKDFSKKKYKTDKSNWNYANIPCKETFGLYFESIQSLFQYIKNIKLEFLKLTFQCNRFVFLSRLLMDLRRT